MTIDPGGQIPVNETGTIKLSCSFDANPPNVSDIIWYKDGNILNKNHGKSLILIEDTSLIIRDATRNHTGFYSCSLKNSFGVGNSTNTAYIDVWCKFFFSLSLFHHSNWWNKKKRLFICNLCDIFCK